MVIAGAKKMKMNVMVANIALREESSARKSWLVKNQPVNNRKTEMTMYAIGELK